MTAKPIPDHPYHDKCDASLRYIIKDAGEAANAMRGYDYAAECKYLDQINDACTILRYRRQLSERNLREHNANILSAIKGANK